jgi:hypothetical protein
MYIFISFTAFNECYSVAGTRPSAKAGSLPLKDLSATKKRNQGGGVGNTSLLR